MTNIITGTITKVILECSHTREVDSAFLTIWPLVWCEQCQRMTKWIKEIEE